MEEVCTRDNFSDLTSDFESHNIYAMKSVMKAAVKTTSSSRNNDASSLVEEEEKEEGEVVVVVR